MPYVLEILFLSCVFIVADSVPIATLDPISNNGIRNIPKNSCHVNGEIFEDGDQVIMTRADLNGEMDPCESCLCVRGEVFCWWGGCPPRRTPPPPTQRPPSGRPSSISPAASTTTTSEEAAAAGGFPESPTLSPSSPPLSGGDSTSAKSSLVETSTPEYPEEEETEDTSFGVSREGAKFDTGNDREGTNKGNGDIYLSSLTTKPNYAAQEDGKRLDDDFDGEIGVEGVEKSPPEGTSELADTVSETGDLDKQSRQQQSPSLDMFDVDAF